MRLEHVAIWTKNMERLKEFYVTYFGAKAGNIYVNTDTGFKSYFLSFDSGARLEIMSKPSIPANLNDPVEQYTGIIHLAFETNTKEEVDGKARQLEKAGFIILKGPRKTGDGYYEFETLDPDNNRLEVTTKY